MGLIDKIFRQPTADQVLDRLSPVSSPPLPPEVSPPCTVAFQRPDGAIEMTGRLVYRYAAAAWEWEDGRVFNRTPTHWMFEQQ
jgi:hypothetical protein